MNGMRATTAVLAAMSLTLAVGCATPADTKPVRAWDQAAVTTLVDELVSRVQQAYAIANKESVAPDAMGSVYTYLNDIRTLESQARELQSELRAGKGYQQTRWNYSEMKEYSRTLLASPSWQAIEGELGATEASQTSIADVLVELDDYYGTR